MARFWKARFFGARFWRSRFWHGPTTTGDTADLPWDFKAYPGTEPAAQHVVAPSGAAVAAEEQPPRPTGLEFAYPEAVPEVGPSPAEVAARLEEERRRAEEAALRALIQEEDEALLNGLFTPPSLLYRIRRVSQN